MAEPTTVSFTVWTDVRGISWYVKHVDAWDVTLERTVVETVPMRDLVRSHRLMNDTHPLIEGGPASRDSDLTGEPS